MPTTNDPLRMPASIMAEAKKASAQDGVSLNQFTSTAVAEKVSALRAQAMLESRAAGADL